MTRKSKRELEQRLEDLGATGRFGMEDYLLANLKGAHDADLSAGERRLLENPEAHLPASDVQRLENLGGPQ